MNKKEHNKKQTNKISLLKSLKSNHYGIVKSLCPQQITQVPSDNFNLLHVKTKVGQCFRNQLMLT